MGAIIADFGKNTDGINLFRINGSKDEIEVAIEKLKKVGCEVWEPYELEKSHKHFSVLLKVKVPLEEEQEKESVPNEK